MFLLFYIVSIVIYMYLLRWLIINECDDCKNITLQDVMILLFFGIIPMVNSILAGVTLIEIAAEINIDGLKLLKKILFIKDKKDK